MLVRYSASNTGSPLKRAEIYTAKEHAIKRSDIDPDALRIALRLKSAGHSVYIVGGAVRDLLIGKKPKDFDLVTDAHPRKLKRLFRNSRIIGKRFRLVHVYFREKIIEVSTFRALDAESNNEFGTIQEDVLRRDFTLNALYYCPIDESLVDYIGGVRDIKKRKIKPLIPLKKIFSEDPVRMIRAVKYAASLDFKIPFFTRRKIRSQAALLAPVSSSRLTEELFKILQCGSSSVILKALYEYGLLQHMMPQLAQALKNGRGDFRERFFASMKGLDESIYEAIERHKLLAPLVKDYLDDLAKERKEEKLMFKDCFHAVKQFLHPLVPSNKDVDAAVVSIFRKKKPKMKGPRGPQPHHPRPLAAT